MIFLASLLLPLQSQVPGPVQNRIRLAQSYRQAGENEKALSIYQEIYAQDPQMHIYNQYLECLEEMGEYEQARRLVRKQMKLSPQPLLLEVDLARTYQQEGSEKKMLAVLRNLVEKGNFLEEGVPMQELATAIEEKTGCYDYAVKVYLKAREEQARTHEVVFSGLYRLETGREAGENFPSPSDQYAFELAELYRKDGQYGPMLDEYARLLSADLSRTEEVFARMQGLSTGPNREKVLEQMRRLLLQRVQKSAQDAVFQRMLIWVLLQQEDFANAVVYAKAYSRRFSDGGQAWFDAIEVAASNHRYELAEEAYTGFIEAGKLQQEMPLSAQLIRRSKVNLLNLYFDRLENMLEKDEAEVTRLRMAYRSLFAELGRDPESFVLYRNLARIYAYYSNQKDSACQLLQQGIDSRRFNAQQTAQLKIDLADVLLFYNKVWDATLLYSQVEKDFKQDAIGFYAKLQNARLSYYIGEFEWARSQLDVLKSATAKLIANDAMELYLLIKEGMNPDSSYEGLYHVAQADFNTYRRLYPQAMEHLDQVLSMPLEGALFDEVNYRKAKICLITGEVGQAMSCLQKVYENPSSHLLTDDALFLQAEILALRAGCAACLSGLSPVPLPLDLVSGILASQATDEQKMSDREHALQLYQEVFTQHRSSSLATPAREKYRLLREWKPGGSPSL